MNPSVSIIMPVYNACEYVEAAVRSVLNQTFKNFELIIVDDGSCDGSFNICLNLRKQDDRIKLHTKKNGGICDARNFGLKYAVGEYVIFIDHDDEWDISLLEDNYKLAQRYNADLVKFGKKNIYISKNTYNEEVVNKGFAVYNYAEIIQNYMLLRYEGVFELVWDGLYKRAVISENKLLFDLFFKRGGEDIDFNSVYIKYISSLVINPVIYYRHYIRYGFSTSTKSNIDIVDAALEHPRRLFIKELSSAEIPLFCLCFAKECLAVSLKTGYYLYSGNFRGNIAFIESLYEIISSDVYYNTILNVKLLDLFKCKDVKMDRIYYIILIFLFRKKYKSILYFLLMMKTKYLDLL